MRKIPAPIFGDLPDPDYPLVQEESSLGVNSIAESITTPIVEEERRLEETDVVKSTSYSKHKNKLLQGITVKQFFFQSVDSSHGGTAKENI